MMLATSDTETVSSLGEILRNNRIKMDIDLETVANETKISINTLKAMEEGDYPALPAVVFARGFYALYAKMLSLDPVEILNLYNQESGNPPNFNQQTTIPPAKRAHLVEDFSERPNSFPFSSIGLLLILLLLFGAFLSWYFSWNPATFLSQKLRSFQENPVRIEKTTDLDRNNFSQSSLVKIVKVSSPLKSYPDDLLFVLKKKQNLSSQSFFSE